MKIIIVFFVVSIGFLACSYPIDYVGKNNQTFLSINGGISNQLEPQTIKLFTTDDRIDYQAITVPVNGAKVYITDEKGSKTEFPQVGEGIYRTAAPTAGKVGSTYQLHMEINGKVYESTAETMVASPAIDSLYYEANVKSTLPKTDAFRDGFDVYVNLKDPIGKGNYYRWSWRHFAQLNICAIKDYQIYHCDTPCFDVSFSQDLNLLADDFVDGQPINHLFIKRVPLVIYQSYVYVYRYYLQVEQQSLNKHTYDLYRALKNAQNVGTLFDIPTLTKFNLNVTCITDPLERIIGVFDVYSSKRKVLNINLNTTINGEKGLIAPILLGAQECPALPCSTPCEEGVFRTKVVPEGW